VVDVNGVGGNRERSSTMKRSMETAAAEVAALQMVGAVTGRDDSDLRRRRS
jgi:hypothetical protein